MKTVVTIIATIGLLLLAACKSDNDKLFDKIQHGEQLSQSEFRTILEYIEEPVLIDARNDRQSRDWIAYQESRKKLNKEYPYYEPFMIYLGKNIDFLDQENYKRFREIQNKVINQ